MRPLILLPGMDGTGELLAPLVRQFGDAVPVEVIGYPPGIRQGYDELVGHVLARLPAQPCILLGESFSGPIAIEIACRHPDRIAGLILASSFVRHPLPSAFASLVPLVSLRFIPTRLIEFRLLGRNADRATARALHDVLRRVSPAVMAHRAGEALRVDKRAELHRTRCPVLCLHGRDDRLVSPRHLALITAARRDAQVHLLDAPHMLLETCTAEAARLIDAFCSGIAPVQVDPAL